MQIYRDSDADLGILKGKKIAVLGYGSQGRAQALCYRDSGLDVTVGVREGKSFEKAKEDGMKVTSVADATKDADVVMMLLPDEAQPDIYEADIKQNLKKGAALEFAHGFSVLSEEAVFTYKCDNLYAPELEGGIAYNDPDLAIDWQIPEAERIISEKDLHHPLLRDVKTNFSL